MESMAGLVKSGLGRLRLLGGMRWLGRRALDLLYPPCCLNCEAPMATPDTLCPACFRSLRPITAPHCPVLGLPFDASTGPDMVSAEALADPPPFSRARSAVIYGEVASTLVSRLKYGDRPELARFCGRLMVGAGHDLWSDAPVLVPVPLHPARQRERRFNQSAELAQVVGRLTGFAVDPLLVRRVRRTRQQVGLSGDGRQRNVAGAFAVDPERLVRIRERRIVIVDDVYTTGATVKAVTRSLGKAGAASVDVLTFARVVIGADLPI
jgi:ComF family protein